MDERRQTGVRTKVDDIFFEVLDELVFVERDDGYVAGVPAAVAVASDLRCPIDPTDDTLGDGIAPGGLQELEEVL